MSKRNRSRRRSAGDRAPTLPPPEPVFDEDDPGRVVPTLEDLEQAAAFSLLDSGGVLGIASRLIREATDLMAERIALSSPERLEALRKVDPPDRARHIRESWFGLSQTEDDGWLSSMSLYSFDPMAVESNLTAWRAQSRFLYLVNEHYSGIIETAVDYIVGSGLQVTPKLNDKEKDKIVTGIVKSLLSNTTFNANERFRTMVRTALKDGDVLLRRPPASTDGVRSFVEWKFMDSDALAPPDKQPGADKYSYTFGVQTPIDDPEAVIAYWPKGQQPIPASEVFHVKSPRTNITAKRGAPWLLTAARRIQRYATWLEDRIILNKIRSAIALVRYHKTKTGGTSLERRADMLASHSSRVQGTPTAATTTNMRRKWIQAGTVLDVDEDKVRLEYLDPKIDASAVADDGRAILLSIAVAVGLPEYMVSGDASNANLASLQVSAAPGVVRLGAMQSHFWAKIGEFIRLTIAPVALASGISEEELAEAEFVVTGPDPIIGDPEAQVRNDVELLEAHVLSRTTMAKRHRLDFAEEAANMRAEDDMLPADETGGPDDIGAQIAGLGSEKEPEPEPTEGEPKTTSKPVKPAAGE